MRVVVLMGGKSQEREISLRSGEAVLNAIRELGYEAIALDIDGELCTKLLELRPDKVFIALHGTYGEDGRIQGFLDILGIPYVGSGVLGSAVAMDKDITKKNTHLSWHTRTQMDERTQWGKYQLEHFSCCGKTCRSRL